MGAQPTKPTDVSDAAWERTQQRKLETIKEQQAEIQKIKEERHVALTRLKINVLEYCSACHDVPWILMLLPNNRRQCATARSRMLDDMTTLASAIANENIVNDTISKISKI